MRSSLAAMSPETTEQHFVVAVADVAQQSDSDIAALSF